MRNGPFILFIKKYTLTIMILNESSRDNLLLPYLELYNSKVGEGEKRTLPDMKKALLRKFVNEALMRNLSLESNYYLAGVARYYFNGDLTTNKVDILNVFSGEAGSTDQFNQEICQRLNALILVLRNAYIDSVGTQFEQPEDFGTLSIAKLLRKYNKAINAELGIETPKKGKKVKPVEEIDRNDSVGNGYTFDILYSYDEARKYHSATEPGAWCITYGEHHYNYYIKQLGIHYVIFRKDGYENVERKKGPNWTRQKPQDEYGNSLIAFLQSNKTGEPVYITSRWNHGAYGDDSSCEADHAYTKEEFMEKTGVTEADIQRIFKIWKTDKPKKDAEGGGVDRKAINAAKLKASRIIKYTQMLLAQGADIESALMPHKDNLSSMVLTNNDKLAELRNSIYKATDEATKESLRKSVRKLLRKSSVGCLLTVDNRKFAFLIDGGKISIDTITDFGDYSGRASWLFNKGNENVILFGTDKHGWVVYDKIRKTPLVVDGKKKFKYVSFSLPWEVKNERTSDNGEYVVNKPDYYVVGTSTTSYALINYRTNEPFLLPNGSPWFEKVVSENTHLVDHGYGNDYAIKLDHYLALGFTYDSARNEYYVYDVKTRSFLDLPNTSYFLYCGGIGNLVEQGCYVIHGYTNNDYNSGVDLIYKDGKRSSEFPDMYSMLNFEDDEFTVMRTVNGEDYINIRDEHSGLATTLKVTIPEEILQDKTPYFRFAEKIGTNRVIVFSLTNKDRDNYGYRTAFGYVVLVYDGNGIRLLKNGVDRNGGYIFPKVTNWYYSGNDFDGYLLIGFFRGNGGIYKIANSNTNSLVPCKIDNDTLVIDREAQVQQVRESKKSVGLTAGDVKTMVSECVKRIIERKLLK